MKDRYIIVDAETGKPMAWSEDDKQIVFCDTITDYPTFSLKSYTKEEAVSAMAKTHRNRRRWNVSRSYFSLMKID